MVKIKKWLGSSVGKKQVVGLTGLALAFFTLTHMSGNLLILFGPKPYNFYSHGLITNPLLPVAEIGLLVAFLIHVGLAIQLTMHNRAARPLGNASTGSGLKRATFASRSMILSGLLVFVFLVLHLITFKYGAHYSVTYDGIEMRDLHRLVLEKFHEPLYVGWYVFSLLVLGLHLSHGVSSVFQSLGFTGARTPWLRQTAWAFAIVIAGGFIAPPVWVLCCGGQ